MKKKRLSVGIAPDDLQNGDFVAIVKNRRRPRHRMVLGDERDGERSKTVNGAQQKKTMVNPFCEKRAT